MGIDDTIGNGNGKEWESPCMGMGMAPIPIGINFHRLMQCLAYIIVTYSLLWHLLFIMTILLLRTILLHLIETVRFSDKLSTMIFHVSWFLDTSKMFMPQRLNDCLGMGMRRNENSPLGIPWELELVTKLGMGMGRNGNWAYGNEREWECKKPFPIISSVKVLGLRCGSPNSYQKRFLWRQVYTCELEQLHV